MTKGACMKKGNDCIEDEKINGDKDNSENIIVIPNLNDPEIKKRLEADFEANICGGQIGGGIPDISPPTYLVKYGITERDVLQCLKDNEDGDANLFIKIFKRECLFDHLEERWYYWNDHYWREDELQHRYRRILNVIDIYFEQVTREIQRKDMYEKKGKEKLVKECEGVIAELMKRKESLQTQFRKNNVLKAASQGTHSLGYSGKDWDQQPHLLAVRNGVINLTKGTFDKSGAGQELYIKTVAPTKWGGIETQCPTWEKFLIDVFAGRPEMPGFIQRLFGYALRGDTPEHIFPICYGAEGRNGKGTLFETIKFVLGQLAYKAPSEFLMTKTNSQQSADAPSATLMKLRGARMVWCSETNEGDVINAAKLKELVGGDTISARQPYGKKQIEFEPTHTLFTMTNKKPRMPPNDPALWRRIFLIPFNMTFVENPDPTKKNQVKADKHLKEKLKTEASGILTWLVKGAIQYEKFGLKPPDEVIIATEQYREDEDIIGHFINECCEIGDTENIAFRTKAKDLYDGYKKWCQDVGHFPMAKKKFRENMLMKFQERMETGTRIRKFFGIALVTDFTYM